VPGAPEDRRERLSLLEQAGGLLYLRAGTAAATRHRQD
jgi:hypothetical protein